MSASLLLNFVFICTLFGLSYGSSDQLLHPLTNYTLQYENSQSSSQPIRTRPANEKLRLAITVILPQDFIRFRNLHVCINRELNKINKSNWEFLRHFVLER
jgi:hypothetical protein